MVAALLSWLNGWMAYINTHTLTHKHTVFAMLGMLSPASRGALMTAGIFLFMFTGSVAVVVVVVVVVAVVVVAVVVVAVDVVVVVVAVFVVALFVDVFVTFL